jgi:hypothetical protein
MSNKPNPESVKKVLAAGIVPGCRVVGTNGDTGIVPPVDQWECGSVNQPDAVWVGTVKLYSSLLDQFATILEPAPSLPDTFNASAHSHLITERFPATDEQP